MSGTVSSLANPSASSASAVGAGRRSARWWPPALWWRLRLAVIVRWSAPELDRRLAAGEALRHNAATAQRARMLTESRSRRRLADGLERALDTALRGPSGFSAAVPPDRRELLAARTVLGALDRRLRDSEPVGAQGVAMLSVLLSDGTSPLYRPTEAGALGSRLRAAAASLEASTT
jgi:hypothetical protein